MSASCVHGLEIQTHPPSSSSSSSSSLCLKVAARIARVIVCGNCRSECPPHLLVASGKLSASAQEVIHGPMKELDAMFSVLASAVINKKSLKTHHFHKAYSTAREHTTVVLLRFHLASLLVLFAARPLHLYAPGVSWSRPYPPFHLSLSLSFNSIVLGPAFFCSYLFFSFFSF